MSIPDYKRDDFYDENGIPRGRRGAPRARCATPIIDKSGKFTWYVVCSGTLVPWDDLVSLYLKNQSRRKTLNANKNS